MIVTTLDSVAGRMTEETLGVVRGTALWTRRITKTSMGGIRHMHANSLRDLDDGLNVAKEQASNSMNQQAIKLGADAIVGLKLEVIEMSNGAFCINACGTAVKTSKLPLAFPALPVLPAAAPAAAEDFDFSIAAFSGRASFEGSVLRH